MAGLGLLNFTKYIRPTVCKNLFHICRTSCKKNYYDILGVPKNADTNTLRKAYYDKARKCHPDTNDANEANLKEFQEISEAYEILSNQNKRRAYDLDYKSSLLNIDMEGLENLEMDSDFFKIHDGNERQD